MRALGSAPRRGSPVVRGSGIFCCRNTLRAGFGILTVQFTPVPNFHICSFCLSTARFASPRLCRLPMVNGSIGAAIQANRRSDDVDHQRLRMANCCSVGENAVQTRVPFRAHLTRDVSLRLASLSALIYHPVCALSVFGCAMIKLCGLAVAVGSPRRRSTGIVAPSVGSGVTTASHQPR